MGLKQSSSPIGEGADGSDSKSSGDGEEVAGGAQSCGRDLDEGEGVDMFFIRGWDLAFGGPSANAFVGATAAAPFSGNLGRAVVCRWKGAVFPTIIIITVIIIINIITNYHFLS